MNSTKHNRGQGNLLADKNRADRCSDIRRASETLESFFHNLCKSRQSSPAGGVELTSSDVDSIAYLSNHIWEIAVALEAGGDA